MNYISDAHALLWHLYNWGSSLRLTLVKKYYRSNVDLTPKLRKGRARLELI
jgi:hypothetical protein